MRQWRYFSATDHNRVSEMESAWRDPSVDAVFYLGCSWGAARVLEAGFCFRRAQMELRLFRQQFPAAGATGRRAPRGGAWFLRRHRCTVATHRSAAAGALSQLLQGDGLWPGIARGPAVTVLKAATMIGTPWLPSFRSRPGSRRCGRRAPRIDECSPSGAAPACCSNWRAWWPLRLGEGRHPAGGLQHGRGAGGTSGRSGHSPCSQSPRAMGTQPGPTLAPSPN